MPILPLYGHDALRRQLRASVDRDGLPASLLLHGPRGVGKQRLALWLGQLLLCTGSGERPCGACQSCRYATELGHPDLHWYFPRPRLKDSDADPEDVQADYADAVAERRARVGLYAPSSGSEGLYVTTVRALLRAAAMSPALGTRKVFVIGDAERMVPQEGAEAAANAFLKLLEEPPADTTIVLTSSEPGALLPTIRSRVVAIRVPPLPPRDVRAMLEDPAVREALSDASLPARLDDRVALAAGAPGVLFGESARAEALAQADRFLAAATGRRAERLRVAFGQGGGRARGAFRDTLDALTLALHRRARSAVARDDAPAALGASRAIEAVERAKMRAHGNVNPQLVSASLLRELSTLLR